MATNARIFKSLGGIALVLAANCTARWQQFRCCSTQHGDDRYDLAPDITPGCAECTVAPEGCWLKATIAGGTSDTAVAQLSISPVSTQRLFFRDVFRLEAGQRIDANLTIVQFVDDTQAPAAEIFLSSERHVLLFMAASLSLPGSIDGGPIPNDGTPVHIEVSLLANDTIEFHVNSNVVRYEASGGMNNPIVRVRVGIDHYDSMNSDSPVTVYHQGVAYSREAPLGPACFETRNP